MGKKSRLKRRPTGLSLEPDEDKLLRYITVGCLEAMGALEPKNLADSGLTRSETIETTFSLILKGYLQIVHNATDNTYRLEPTALLDAQ